MIYGLPKSIEIAGVSYAIRSDFREILEIMSVLNDAELTDQERGFFALLIFYPDFETIPEDRYQEALEKCFWFINGGSEDEPSEKKPVLMDWEKDFPIIIAPVNRVLGHEARADEYLHWWTFLSAYMEIGGDCTFAQVVHIRDLLRQGKPLDSSDREWYRKNRSMVDMKAKFTSDELEELKKWGG